MTIRSLTDCEVFWTLFAYNRETNDCLAACLVAKTEPRQLRESGPDWARTSDPALIKRML
jgi:hypothetical protein